MLIFLSVLVHLATRPLRLYVAYQGTYCVKPLVSSVLFFVGIPTLSFSGSLVPECLEMYFAMLWNEEIYRKINVQNRVTKGPAITQKNLN